jgi:hypothetical protein
MKNTAEMTDYELWWYNEGSAIRPIDGHDHEEHAERVCKIAWENGAFKALEPRQGEIV